MSYVVAYNTYSFSKNKFILFLGCGYFWVGIVDLFHTLSFENMGVFTHTSPSTSLHLWIFARYLEGLILLIAPFNFIKKLRPKYIFLGLGISSLIFLILAFQVIPTTYSLPDLYTQNAGLSDSKIFNEYLIIAILCVASVNYAWFAKHIDKSTRNLLIVSTVLTIAAELNFTLYANMGDIPLIIGHLFKLFSFWAIYRALIESSLTRPFTSLSKVVSSYDKVSEPTVIIDQDGVIQNANKAVRSTKGRAVIGQHCHEVLHNAAINKQDCSICMAIQNKTTLTACELFSAPDQRWYEISLSAIHDTDNYSAMVHSRRDINQRKDTENQFASLNKLYLILSHTNKAIVLFQDRDKLFQEVCDIAIKHGDFKMAWIGIIEDSVIKPKFVSGASDGYFESMQMRIDNSEWSKGPVGIAANTKQVAFVNDVNTNPDFWPWRKAALERGYASLAAVPLVFDGAVIAIFTLYSKQRNVFDKKMATLLSQLSNDISSALYHINQAKIKVKTDNTIRTLSSAVEQSADAIIITNTGGVIEYVNPEFTQLTGYTSEEAISQRTSILKSSKNPDSIYDEMWSSISAGIIWRGELLNKKKNGELYWSHQTITPIFDPSGKVTNFVSTSTDNTKLHKAQEKIEQLAFYDPLTKLANRRLFIDRLEHAVITAQRHNESVALLMFDLDNFKHVNDSLGHEYGDQLLQHVANILEADTHEEDTVARLGGDEFTIVLNDFKNELSVAEIASKILIKLGEPILLKDKQIVVSSSIGVALFPQDGSSVQKLMRSADLAMYHAKAEGKNCFHFYEKEMNDRAQGRLQIENDLRKAIENDSFELFYQPQVEIHSKTIIGFEALIRWKDDTGTYIPPFKFIPVAEDSGLIGIIGDWVLKKAISDWDQMLAHGYEDVRMAVNVSAFQFKQSEHLCELIQECLRKHPRCHPQGLTIELTESTLIDDIEGTIETLNIIKSLGVNLSIDDFGTGYSSLNYLKRFPVDQLKIDKSFVDDMLEGESHEAVVTAIISIAQKLKMKVIAEGVESAAQGKFLYNHACEYAQGYHYYKPMPLDAVKKLSLSRT
jgi:diguanylate cyclase (GGDEF)-like protein/PAS domain S-box-containing protein